MFNEREMSKAIDWLFELFSPEDYEGYDEDEIGYAGGLCLPEVCTALRGAAQTVYQYSVAGGYEKCFNYRGMELFDQRACLIISDVEQAVLDISATNTQRYLQQTSVTGIWSLQIQRARPTNFVAPCVPSLKFRALTFQICSATVWICPICMFLMGTTSRTL